jgi:hypothetical protein
MPLAFRIVFAALGRVRESRSRQILQLLRECSQPAFNVSSVPGLLHRTPLQFHAVVLASSVEHRPVEFFGVIEVQPLNTPADRPRRRDSVFRQPNALGQYGMSQAQARGHCSRRIEGHLKASDHAAENVDGQCNPRPAHRLTSEIINENDAHLRVIDLDHLKCSLRRREVTCQWFKDAGGLTAVAAAHLHMFR